MDTKNLLGATRYFIDNGTWDGVYQWKIEKGKISAISLNEAGKIYVTIGYHDIAIDNLRFTFDAAKKSAVTEINKEKNRLIDMIKNQTE